MAFDMGDYVDVAARITEFYEKYPDGRLVTEKYEYREGLVIVSALAYRTPDDPLPARGLASEPLPGKTPYTRDSELMNAETSAWGRAIVALGFPTKHIASHQEVRNRQYEGREVPPDIERNFNMNDYEPVGVQRGKNGRPNWDAFWAWARPLGLSSEQLGSYLNRPNMKGATQVELDRVRQLVTQEMDHDLPFSED